MKGTICVITGSRAEYGLLRPLLLRLQADPEIALEILVTGMHLAPEFGGTYREIEADGLHIGERVETLLSSDTPVGVSKAIGLGVIGIADALARRGPDMVVLLGDRFEIFAAAQAAMIAQIPIAHIGGGDIGAGTYDNVIRHCLTKMASLHFVTHEAARTRVLQLGERPEHVIDAGSLSVDNINTVPLLTREALSARLDWSVSDGDLLAVTYHPLTIQQADGMAELNALLTALDRYAETSAVRIVFTMANADNGGRGVNAALTSYVSSRPHTHLVPSLGQQGYLSLVHYAAMVVGNSSSGIYEAAYLGTPTVDIGSRQSGRMAPASVVRSAAQPDAILAAMNAAREIDMQAVDMIYGDGHAAGVIHEALRRHLGGRELIEKTFVDRIEAT